MNGPTPIAFGTDADVALFRRAVGRFATGICVVTAVADGLDHAMTANAFASVSLEPVLVLVCVERQARFHDAVETAGQWAVSILDASARGTSEWLSTRGRPLHGQLDRVQHARGELTGAPLIGAAVSWLECRTVNLVEAGDHSIVVGQVLGCGLGPDSAAALVYHRGRYGHLD